MIKLNIQRFASTNKTANYELSQYVNTDKPSYLGDYNSDMEKIDNAIHTNATNIYGVDAKAETAKTTADTALSNANEADSKATNAQATATSALEKSTANEVEIANLKQSTSRETIFTGSANMNSPITLTKNWSEIGKFKNLLVDIIDSSTNGITSVSFQFEILSDGNNLFDGKKTVNAFKLIALSANIQTYIHLIPASDITENTIKFDSSLSTATINSIYIDY